MIFTLIELVVLSLLSFVVLWPMLRAPALLPAVAAITFDVPDVTFSARGFV